MAESKVKSCAATRFAILGKTAPKRKFLSNAWLAAKREMAAPAIVLLRVSLFLNLRHPTEQKTAFYNNLCAELQRSCNIQPSDLMVSIVGNTDEDWSFGLGRAQYLTGELGEQKGGAPKRLASSTAT